MAAALLLFSVAAIALELVILPATGARLLYPMDDTYIQMAIAKNLVRDGTWGISHEFANAGTSLVWPVLLAGVYAVTGVNDITPLVLNFVTGLIVLAIAARVLQRHLEPPLVAVTLAALVFAIPLFHVYRLGMEHTLACAVALWSVAAVARSAALSQRLAWPVLLSGAFLIAVRFDLAAVVAPLAVVLALRVGRGAALTFTALAAVPAAVAAANAWRHGWPLLPTPILLKHRLATIDTSVHGIASIFGGGLAWLVKTPVLLVIVIVCLWLIVTRRDDDPRRGEATIIQAVTIAAIFLHVHFGQTGWMYRYETHLVTMGVVAIAADGRRILPSIGPARRLAAALFVVVLLSPFAMRCFLAVEELVSETRLSRYEFEMTEFFQHYRPQTGVVVGHVGVLGYLTDLPIVDSMGLLTPELLSPGHQVDPRLLNRVARERGVRVSLEPAEGWQCVGEWELDEVRERIHAADDETALQLADDLTRFAAARGVPVTLGAEGCQRAGR